MILIFIQSSPRVCIVYTLEIFILDIVSSEILSSNNMCLEFFYICDKNEKEIQKYYIFFILIGLCKTIQPKSMMKNEFMHLVVGYDGFCDFFCYIYI